jgi:hypothetical protein
MNCGRATTKWLSEGSWKRKVSEIGAITGFICMSFENLTVPDISITRT